MSVVYCKTNHTNTRETATILKKYPLYNYCLEGKQHNFCYY